MKKKNIIIILIAIIILAIIAIVIYNKAVEDGRKYEIEKISEYKYFVLKQGEKYGVIDTKGNNILEVKYDEVKIPNPQKAVFICKEGNDTKVLNEKNTEIFTKYADVEPIRLKNLQSDLMYEKSVLVYQSDNKYGLIDFEGKELTKPIYDEVSNLTYKEGEMLVKQNDKYGVINIKGNILVPVEYDEIFADKYYTEESSYKNAGYIVSVKTDEGFRYGYIDVNGKKLLDTQYNEVSRITDIEDPNNVFLLCAKNGQYGVYQNEEELIPNEFQSITYDKPNKVFIVERSKVYGVRDTTGKEIIPVQYNQIDVTGIYLYAQNDQGVTVYTATGKETNLSPNLAVLSCENSNYNIRIDSMDGTKYGVVNQDGKIIIEEKYAYIEYLFENYFVASLDNGKLGVIDDADNQVVEIKYDSVQQIAGKDIVQATMSDGNMVEFYDKNMKKICSMTNVSNVDVEDEFVRIYNDVESKYFDNSGKEISNFEAYPNNRLFAKAENGKWGFVDKTGNIVVDFQYDEVSEFNEYGFAAVLKDGKWGSLNENGDVVADCIFEFDDSAGVPCFLGKYYEVVYGFGEIYYTDDAV